MSPPCWRMHFWRNLEVIQFGRSTPDTRDHANATGFPLPPHSGLAIGSGVPTVARPIPEFCYAPSQEPGLPSLLAASSRNPLSIVSIHRFRIISTLDYHSRLCYILQGIIIESSSNCLSKVHICRRKEVHQTSAQQNSLCVPMEK